jgi:hypothetical protein
MKRSLWIVLFFGACAPALTGLSCSNAAEKAAIDKAVPAKRSPHIDPDYDGVVIPPNIAPLNFVVNEPGSQYVVRVHAKQGDPIELRSRAGSITIPLREWKGLLRANAGETIGAEVNVRRPDGRWSRFDPVSIAISRDEIDGYLTYRLLRPIYSRYVTMGIYQRDLATYDERPVLRNSEFDQGCVNCHTFLKNDTNTMALHIRTKAHGKPMLVVRNGEVSTVLKPAGYLSWHPSGRLLAFSANKLSLLYHSIGEPRDVFDAASDLGIYMVDSNTMVMPSKIAQPEVQETWPAWSPDGEYLYYCSAPKLPIEQFNQIRYSLMRIRYDADRNAWGDPETVLSDKETSLSITEPKVSPDGRFVLVTTAPYGNFPVYRQDSDLYLMDLASRKWRRLELNSNQADSWHSWSSNSRWIVFSSKRRDGMLARPYFSHVAADGTVSKPFLMPQKDPTYYDRLVKTYNVPELTRAPIRISARELSRAVLAPRKPLKPDLDTHQEEEYVGPEAAQKEKLPTN